MKTLKFVVADVRSHDLAALFSMEKPDIVVHLASIVTPGKGSTPGIEYAVDVLGTENVLQCSVKSGVKKIIVTSSGAAYGYYRDLPRWIAEDAPLRGNDEFPYSRHKRLVEEMLARYRSEHPELKQLIFRPCTVLGKGVSNQITALFEKRIIPGVFGGDTRFVFIWDRDVAGAIIRGIEKDAAGIYNLAGDGAITLREMARMMGKFYLPLPAFSLKLLFAVLKPLGLSRYGPEQVNFLRYRPVLSNEKLKHEFGYVPVLTSAEVFSRYLDGGWDR